MTTNAPRLLTVDEALSTGAPLLALRSHALSAVAALVPASLLLFLTMSRRLTLLDAVAMQTAPLAAPMTELWDRYLDAGQRHDPLATERVAADAVVVGLHDVEVPEPYAAFLSDIGMGDCLMMYLRVSGTVAAAIVLVRTVDQPRFGRQETITLRRMHPLMQHAYAAAVSPPEDDTRNVLRDSGLSVREADVAELVGRGATNAEIARTLHVTEATVKTHLRHIYAKVGVTSRTQLAILVGGDEGRAATHGAEPETTTFG